MDPLLNSLASDQLQGLIREQRPEWALGRDRVGGFQSVNNPEVAARRFAAASPQEASSNVWQTFREDATPGFWSNAAKLLAEMGKASQKKVTEEGPSMWDVAGNFPGAGAVLVGARAAKTMGGLQEAKFLAGKAELEAGKAAQDVWRRWGVGKTKEGDYVFELPFQKGESDAIRQFSQAYPDVTVNVMRRSGPREGWFDPKSGEIYASGKVGVEPTASGSRRAVVEHELQHYADMIEGRSYGTQLADPMYWRNAAEVRARAVERRLDPRERVWEPSFHEDVDRLKQIIKSHPGAVSEAQRDRPTRQFGFQGMHERVVEYPTSRIEKYSVTTPEYRDSKVVAESGRPVTKPITAVVENPDDPESAIHIVDGWHRYRQAVANGDKTIPMRMIFKPRK